MLKWEGSDVTSQTWTHLTRKERLVLGSERLIQTAELFRAKRQWLNLHNPGFVCFGRSCCLHLQDVWRDFSIHCSGNIQSYWKLYGSISQPLWDRGPVNSFFISHYPGRFVLSPVDIWQQKNCWRHFQEIYFGQFCNKTRNRANFPHYRTERQTL